MEEFANSYTGQTQDGTQADGDQYNTPEENELTSSQEDSYEGESNQSTHCKVSGTFTQYNADI